MAERDNVKLIRSVYFNNSFVKPEILQYVCLMIFGLLCKIKVTNLLPFNIVYYFLEYQTKVDMFGILINFLKVI
jgi:hypothetical protein